MFNFQSDVTTLKRLEQIILGVGPAPSSCAGSDLGRQTTVSFLFFKAAAGLLVPLRHAIATASSSWHVVSKWA
jgi:hypothetical protein